MSRTSPKFYICEICGNLAVLVEDSGVEMECCSQAMTELVPNTTDGATEKHVPVYSIDGNTVRVQVGSTLHPMLDEHFIGWIRLETNQGGHRRVLKPGDSPEATFVLNPGETPVSVYEWCNLHGLWRADF